MLLLLLVLTSVHPYTIQDQVMMRRVSAVAVSPDQLTVAYTLRTTDLDKNAGRKDLWTVSADGKNTRRLTSHIESDSDPAWSKNGKHVYFLSGRSGSSQVWRVAIDGGEAEQVTAFTYDVDTFRLAPDDKTIVFSTETALTEQKKKLGSGQLYDRIFMRHWDTWKDGRRSHLYVWRPGEKARDLMPGVDMDAPTKPFGDVGEYTFTPDGKALVFTARDLGKLEPLSTDLDLWFIPLDGKSEPQKAHHTEPRHRHPTPLFSRRQAHRLRGDEPCRLRVGQARSGRARLDE